MMHPQFTYLECGIFYNILNEDAKILNEKLGLKLTSLSPEIIKCGFPVSSLDKYTKKLDEMQIKYVVIDELSNDGNIADYSNIEVKRILKKIMDLDMNNVTFQQAFNILLDTQNKLKKIK